MKDKGILKQYIEQISRYPRVSPEEEIDLAKKIQKGDEVALEKLINANLKLVVKISMDLCRGTSSIMDVIQNGNLGLITAAKKFDVERGVRFSTYSAFWIKQSILRGFIKPNQGISFSYRKDEINKKIKSYIRDYFSKTGKLPIIEDIVTDLRVKRRDAVDVLLLHRGNGGFISNNYLQETNEDIIETVGDNHYNPEFVVEGKMMSEDIIQALESFPQRESEIIKERFGFSSENKTTLSVLGNKYAISAEATRQIERKVLALLKSRFPALGYYYYAG